MSSSIYTFWQLLNGKPEMPDARPVVIPVIQRDYAQGRLDEKTTRIRKELVASLRDALVSGTPLRLDFIYGSREDAFIPLDGQQRLTTLFLLHWYLAARDGKLQMAREALSRFTYETRISSRDFCQELVLWEPELSDLEKPSKAICDTRWYRPAWKFDPTIQGMLVMVDEIAAQLRSTTDLFENLEGGDCPIDFHFLDMKGMALTDDLYLKMNARGKVLTDFENWKARFDKFLEKKHRSELYQDRAFATVFGERMDGKWLDLFWEYKNKDSITDEAAQNLFGYLTRMLAYGTDVSEKELSPLEGKKRVSLPFAMYEQIYAAPEKVRELFGALDLLAEWQQRPGGTDGFVDSLLSEKQQSERVVLFSGKADLLKQTMSEALADLEPQVLLYSLINYGIARGKQEVIKADMLDLLRIVRNVLERERQRNDTKINSDLRYDRLPTLLPAVRKLARLTAEQGNTYGVLATADNAMLAGLGSKAGKHEQQKALLLLAQPELRPVLHQLEDLPVLHGDLHNLPLDPVAKELRELSEALTEIWTSGAAQHRIIGAWLTQGEYWVETGDTGWGEKNFFGSERNWYTVLAADDSSVAETLPSFLRAYLRAEGENPEAKLDYLRNQWLAESPDKNTWRYYFVAYPEMSSYENWGINGSYAWQSDFQMHLMKGAKLSSQHINPYVRTVLRRGNHKKLLKEEQLTWKNDKVPTPLQLLPQASWPTGANVPELHCEDRGWRLVLGQGCTLAQDLLEAYGLEHDANGSLWLVQPIDKDRIEVVENFVLTMDWSRLQWS